MSPRKALVSLTIFMVIMVVGGSSGVDQTITFVVAAAAAFGTLVVRIGL